MADGHPHIGSYRGIRKNSQAAQKSELLNRLRTDFPNSRLNAIEIRGARAFCFYEVFCSARQHAPYRAFCFFILPAPVKSDG